MILIWNGLGILVAIIWFVSIFVGDKLAKALFGPEVSNGRCNLTGEWLAASLTLLLALAIRFHNKSTTDPWEAQTAEQPTHSLFFIPVIFWPAIFFVIGIVVSFK